MNRKIKKLTIFLFILVFSIPAFSMDELLKEWSFSLAETTEKSLVGSFSANFSPANNGIYTKKRDSVNSNEDSDSLTMDEFSYSTLSLRLYDDGEGESKPELSPPRLLGEFLAGGFLGIVGSIGFIIIMPGQGLKYGSGRVVSFCVGSAVGSSLGIYLIGNLGNQTGSYWATLGGSFLGLGTIVLSPIMVWVGPVLGGIVGFNLTRRYTDSQSSGKSLINFTDGKMNWAFPRITVRSNPYVRGDLIQTINLVKVSF